MSETNQADTTATLPCRGCVASCPYKERCQGTPWRTLPEAIAKQRDRGHD